MKIALPLIIIIVLTGLLVDGVQIVDASSKIIVVPDDYPSIPEAIGNATDGDTVFIKKGTYNETSLKINKSLSLIGEDRVNTVINLSPPYNVTWILTTPFFDYSDAISINANDCKILNLTINIANPGGFISAIGNRTQIINNKISTGASTGLTINGSYCNITDNIMGGRIILSGSFNQVVKNSFSFIYLDGNSNLIKDNICEHIGLGYYTNQTISHNVFVGNKVETASRGYGGISLTKSTNNLFYHNYVSGFAAAIRLWFSPNNTIIGNTIADSFEIFAFGSSSNNIIHHNNFVKNMFKTYYVNEQYIDPNIRNANPTMSVSTNNWNNETKGNYWENYNGTDSNFDGVGDTPYIIYERNNAQFAYAKDYFPLMNPVDTSNVSVDLPDWAYTLIINFPTSSPSPTPVPSDTPASTLTPTITAPPSSMSTFPLTPQPSTIESNTPTMTFTASPSPTIPEFTSVALLLIALAASLMLIVLKKKRFR